MCPAALIPPGPPASVAEQSQVFQSINAATEHLLHGHCSLGTPTGPAEPRKGKAQTRGGFCTAARGSGHFCASLAHQPCREQGAALSSGPSPSFLLLLSWATRDDFKGDTFSCDPLSVRSDLFLNTLSQNTASPAGLQPQPPQPCPAVPPPPPAPRLAPQPHLSASLSSLARSSSRASCRSAMRRMAVPRSACSPCRAAATSASCCSCGTARGQCQP